jgi:hypothetical protein
MFELRLVNGYNADVNTLSLLHSPATVSFRLSYVSGERQQIHWTTGPASDTSNLALEPVVRGLSQVQLSVAEAEMCSRGARSLLFVGARRMAILRDAYGSVYARSRCPRRSQSRVSAARK